ncbi:MAG: hypothetical protein AAF961_03660 [Planctomycetota bacterium]
MLEADYQQRLEQLLASCECDVAVPAQWKDLLSQRGVLAPIPDDRQQFVRHLFNGRAVLEYDQTLPAISRKHHVAQVVTRDVSRRGVRFLHSEQLFPGEECALWLNTGRQTYEVVRCIRHNSRCFEIGAALRTRKD